MSGKKKGYVLAIIDIHDLETFKEYPVRTPAAVAKYGGRFLSRGTDYVKTEGEDTGSRVVLLEFESFDVAKEFYESVEYQEAAAYRQRSAHTHFYVLNGYDHALLFNVGGKNSQ